MSLLALLRGTRRALYIGNRTHGETQDTVIWDVDTRAGDLVAISHLSSRSIIASGWTKHTRGQLAVSWKRLTQADIDTPTTFSDVTNMIAQTVRGPRSLSAERTGVSFSGSTTFAGDFAKSSGCMGFLGVTSSEFDDISIQTSPNIFNLDTTNVGPDAFSLTSRVGLTPSLYVDGTDFFVNASIFGSDKEASVFEFLF